MIFVYHNDHKYYEPYTAELQEFDSEAEAAGFIAERMKDHPEATPQNYVVIRGEKVDHDSLIAKPKNES